MILKTKIFHSKSGCLFEKGKKQKINIEKAINRWMEKNKIKKIEDKLYNHCPADDFDETIIIFYKEPK